MFLNFKILLEGPKISSTYALIKIKCTQFLTKYLNFLNTVKVIEFNLKLISSTTHTFFAYSLMMQEYCTIQYYSSMQSAVKICMYRRTQYRWLYGSVECCMWGSIQIGIQSHTHTHIRHTSIASAGSVRISHLSSHFTKKKIILYILYLTTKLKQNCKANSNKKMRRD